MCKTCAKVQRVAMARQAVAVAVTRRHWGHILLIVLAILACAPASFATERAGSAVLMYRDSDHVTVWKPVGTVSSDQGQLSAHARWSTDFISAASVDLVTAASPGGYTEQRHESELGGGWAFGEGRRLDLSATVSRERDFRSDAIGLSGNWEWFDRRLTAVAGVGLAAAATGRAGDAQLWRDRTSRDAHVQASLVLTPHSVLDLVWTIQQLQGYQASLYRYVRLFQGDSPLHQTAVTEQVPGERVRHAGLLRLRQRLGQAWFAQLDYRLYGDTWGMVAHTAATRALWTLPGDAWTLSAEGRAHSQTGASFYRGVYQTLPEAPQWRTADKELGPMWTASGGLHLEWTARPTPAQAVRVGIGGDVMHMRYLDHPYLRERTALLATIDLSWER
jgi:hypothetical protein